MLRLLNVSTVVMAMFAIFMAIKAGLEYLDPEIGVGMHPMLAGFCVGISLLCAVCAVVMLTKDID